MIPKLLWSTLAVFIFSLILLFLALYFDLFQTQFTPLEEVKTLKSQKITSPLNTEIKRLKIMTWNIKFAAGRIDMFFDCHGDRKQIKHEEVMKHLKALAQRIHEEDPDVLFLQEVDILSYRTANVDQLGYLLNHTDLNYAVYASQWKSKFIPANNIGKINSGNAILSKYPLTHAQRHALPLIGTQNIITQYFYLKRNFLTTKLKVNSQTITLINTHLSAYAQDHTKLKQIQQINSYLKGLQEEKKAYIFAGDLNLLPPHTQKLHDFPDSKCKDKYQAGNFTKQTAWLKPLYENNYPAIPLLKYKANNTPYFTHTTDKKGFWNRKLDYIFSNKKLLEGRTIQEKSMEISDHAAITAFYPLIEPTHH